ncbi:hypothetical protein N665_0030s0088 [Sinapis alba]|nr:hypothetical protein N665_0030s0088 [Sinapis alba]
MSRNAISDEEGLILPLPVYDHELEHEEGAPVHGDPVENPENVDEYEKEERRVINDNNEYKNDGFIVGDEEELAVEEDVVGSEDEMADFIVDEDGNGHLSKRDHKKKKYMQDANEISGDVAELLLIRKKGLASSERMKITEESTGSPPVDERSIEEENSLNQL